MSDQTTGIFAQAFELAAKDPEAAEAISKALLHVVYFYKTRGNLLRTYNQPQPKDSK